MTEHSAEIDGHLVVWRQAQTDPGAAPVLWVHGVPDSGAMWLPFLEEAGGIAPDLPGFGRSGKRADFPYTIDGYAAFLERFCDHLELEHIRLVVHDWGAVGLAMAARRPARVERIVAINPVPFVEGFRWHRIARIWRTPLVGELAMSLTNRFVARRVARGMPAGQLDEALRNLDHGTQRAILRLYRSSGPEVLAAAGEQLSKIGAPAFLLAGESDPYLPPRHAQALAGRLGHGKVEILSAVGHWIPPGRGELTSRILRLI